jgi:hypothetical protein
MFGQIFRFFPYEIPMAFYDSLYLVEDKILPVENRQISLPFEQKLRAIFQTPFRSTSPLSLLEVIHPAMNPLQKFGASSESVVFSPKIDVKKLSLLLFSPDRPRRMEEMGQVP